MLVCSGTHSLLPDDLAEVDLVVRGVSFQLGSRSPEHLEGFQEPFNVGTVGDGTDWGFVEHEGPPEDFFILFEFVMGRASQKLLNKGS